MSNLVGHSNGMSLYLTGNGEFCFLSDGVSTLIDGAGPINFSAAAMEISRCIMAAPLSSIGEEIQCETWYELQLLSSDVNPEIWGTDPSMVGFYA